MTKISALTPLGDGLAVGDQFIIRDIDDAGTPNKSVTISGITRGLEVGTALAPSIAFAADKNTGIYGTGSDVLALVTAGENRLHITAGGLVGIGTSSPSESIHTTGKLRVGDGGNYTVAAVQLGASNANGISYPGTNILNFITNSTAALTIDASQRVGIGTTEPQGKLESAAGDSTSYSIVANNSYSTGDQNYISLTASTTQIGSINRVTNDIAIKSNYDGIVFWTGTGGTATQKAKIDSDGRLLVGTPTDLTGALLQVNGAMNSNKYQQNVPTGSTDTIFTMAASQCYHIYATEGTSQTHSVAIASCAEGSSTAVLTSLYQSSANTVLSASGLNIQVYNGAGSTRTIKTTILRMA